MKVMKISVLVTLAIIAATALLFDNNNSKTKAAMAACTVPGTHGTIQAAVSDVTCATIDVAPGVYNENVSVTRPVTINGAQAGVPAPGRVAAESVVNGANPVGAVSVFLVGASGVVIDGFTVKNSVTISAAHGIAVNGSGSGAVIKNNIFDGITTADTGGNGTAQAVYLTSGGPDNVTIENNEMRNIQSNRSAKGVLIGDNGGTNPSQNVQIKGNSIHDVTSDTRGGYGVSVANVLNVSGLNIDQNTISNLTGGGWVHAIGLEGDTPSVTVTGNDISNLTDLTPTVPADSIAVFFEANPSFGTAEVHNNNFNLTAASYGIAVHPGIVGSGAVDGSCNWWGSPSGPTATSNPAGTGAQVSPRVSYQPWLIAPGPGGECLGGNVPTAASQCKNGGWMTRVRADGSTFKNQGDCIQYVNTQK
jgi:hypothetical protein